jgi:hypothetical protein
MLLTPADLEALTGYSRPAHQARWLREHGWPFEVGGDRRPKVLRAYAERRLGGVNSPPRDPKLHLAARA